MRPTLDLTAHLGLYTAFHRARGNRLAHAILVPVILGSAMCLQAYVGLSTFAHLGTLLSFALAALLSLVDVMGALVLLGMLIPMSLLAGAIALHVSPYIVIPTALAVHALGWYGTVVIGHERIEPRITIGNTSEDSNVYFRRNYFRGQHLGVAVNQTDQLIQFCIAPLACVQDLLWALGLRQSLEPRIASERRQILDALGSGRPPLTHRIALTNPQHHAPQTAGN